MHSEIYNSVNEILTSCLLAVIAFFLVRYINRSDKMFDYFTEKIDKLDININILLTKLAENEKHCEILHKEINKKIESIEKQKEKQK